VSKTISKIKISLLEDEDSNIQEQCLNLLRNVAHGEYEDISFLINELDEKLIPILVNNLQSKHIGVIIQTLYIISNIAAGNPTHKEKVMNADILKNVISFLQSSNRHIRVASLWVLINLTWRDDQGVEERKKILRELHCDKHLISLANDSELDVRDRVRQAIDQLK
jgi:armadillo repeat-containing protein 8